MLIDYFFQFYISLVVAFFLILFGYLHYADQEDGLNNMLAFGAMFFVFLHVLAFLILMFQSEYLRVAAIPNWMVALGLPILIIGITILISSALVQLFRLFVKERDHTDRDEKWAKKMEDMSKVKRDNYRKISHVLIFIVLFIIWAIGFNFVMNAEGKWVGMIPENNNTLELYLRLLTEPESIRSVLYSLGWFYYLIFFFFFAFCLFMVTNELTRKSKHLAFPFNLLPQLVMTEEEKKSYGTYVYFNIGQMFAAFLCPPMVYFAILGMSGLADLMTSQVGIRWGKHHIKWNDHKTWEGNIAGTVAAFIICLPFIGIIWAAIFSIAFMAIDLLTAKPFNISDNLLIPIGCAVIYIFIRYYLDLDYTVFVYTFFT